jgi:hypothetical protein
MYMKVAEPPLAGDESPHWFRQLGGGPKIVEDPVPDGSDQYGRRPALWLAGRLECRATAADDHLDQYGSIVLAGKGVLWKFFEPLKLPIST